MLILTEGNKMEATAVVWIIVDGHDAIQHADIPDGNPTALKISKCMFVKREMAISLWKEYFYLK